MVKGVTVFVPVGAPYWWSSEGGGWALGSYLRLSKGWGVIGS